MPVKVSPTAQPSPEAAPVAVSAAPAEQSTTVAGVRIVQAPNQPVPLPQQISAPVHKFITEPDGAHTLVIKLAPAHLGPVTVRAVLDGGQTRIELVAPTDTAKDLIRSFIGEIRRDLSVSGLSAVVSISTDSSTSQNSSHSNTSQGSQHGSSNGSSPQGGNPQGSPRERPQPHVLPHLTGTPSESVLDLEV